MSYGIGLDCGIASVGYSVLQLNENDEPMKIIRLGSRVFDKAEVPKTGASLAAPRRQKRGLRRRLRRHTHRNERIKQLIVNEKILSEEKLDTLFDGKLEDIYAIRKNALDMKLTNEQFARVLIHIAQRRGFKSNRKNDAKDKEAGKLLNAVSENTALMQAKGYRTVGEMFCCDEKFSESKRNKAENYKGTVSRDMVLCEIVLIFEAQRKYGNEFATKEIEESYTAIVASQRSFEDGPGGDSKYGGNQIEKMIGSCTLIPEEKRAPKASYSFQYFNLLQNVNNIYISNSSEGRNLTDTEKKAVITLCFESPDVNYEKIRKLLQLPDDWFFNKVRYLEDTAKSEKGTKFNYLKAYHEIRKVLDKSLAKGYIKNLSTSQLNSIGYAFTVFKTDDTLREYLEAEGFNNLEIEALLNLDAFSKFGHISVKACDAIIPYLEQGKKYNDACEMAGLNFKGHNGDEKSKYLPANAPELENITNPVVRRSISQTIKVVNAIIREQGESPTYINIELARELSKDFNERLDIEKKSKENHANNERLLECIRDEYEINNPTGQDLLKFKLWKEQDGICPYSQKPIKIEHLFEGGYADIDHIVPYSISFDDSYNNKVLTLSEENRQKGNKLPMQYLEGKAKENFIVWVNTSVRSQKKKKNLLLEKVNDDNAFKARNLSDTAYLSTALYNYITDNLQFADYKTGKKKHVKSVNGAVTAYMRKRWGIRKIREDGDLHHAVDATVVACVTDGMIQRITSYAKNKELEYVEYESGSLVVNKNTGEVKAQLPMPYPEFRKELDARTMNNVQEAIKSLRLTTYTPDEIAELKPPFVSRMPNHKVTGPAHQDTIRSGKKDGFVVAKTPLSKLKLDKNGEIEGYPEENKKSDTLLYKALVDRLSKFSGVGEKAFPNDYVFRKPKSDGTPGPVVKTVKIEKKSSLNVAVRDGNGVADNGSMVRIDVFYVDGEGYYFVPIYVADTVKKELPNKAVVQSKVYADWKEMAEENFVFSLYPNDLIYVKTSKGKELSLNLKNSTLPPKHYFKEGFLYYVCANISKASIMVENHDGSYCMDGLGLKTLVEIQKWVVDPLGNLTRVEKEQRMRFN